jgi:hypothetical protein
VAVQRHAVVQAAVVDLGLQRLAVIAVARDLEHGLGHVLQHVECG